jgi:hypothetical protein
MIKMVFMMAKSPMFKKFLLLDLIVKDLIHFDGYFPECSSELFPQVRYL